MPEVKTPIFRVSYSRVFEAKLGELSGKMEYSLMALFQAGADLSALKKAATEAAKEMWGPKLPKKLRSPFRDQAELEREVDVDGGGTKLIMPEGCVKGAVFMNFKSYKQPAIVGPDGKTKILDEEEFYSGVWARAIVNASAYEVKGNAGVSFWVNYLQKIKDGEPLSGRRKIEDCFEPVAQEEGASADVFGDGDKGEAEASPF